MSTQFSEGDRYRIEEILRKVEWLQKEVCELRRATQSGQRAGVAEERAPFGAALHEMDIEAFLNMRNWLRKAVEGAGAKMTGGGIGLGQADIDIKFDGFDYNISIRPLVAAPTQQEEGK